MMAKVVGDDALHLAIAMIAAGLATQPQRLADLPSGGFQHARLQLREELSAQALID